MAKKNYKIGHYLVISLAILILITYLGTNTSQLYSIKDDPRRIHGMYLEFSVNVNPS